jgi:diketogulonate reductase-like aldo/keto reductase
VETIDLYQLHEPNPEVPIEETMGAMAELVDAGKVKFVGVSNFTVPQLRAAQAALGKYPVVSNQVRYSLIDRTVERGLLAYCQANNITVIAYSPLARGLDRIHDCDSSGVLESIARSTGKSVAQIAVNWCLCHDGVVAIPKGNTAEHVLEICGSSDWRLDDEQMQALNSRVLFRHRNALDAMIRRLVPSSARKIALKAVKLLPRSIRSRIR